MDAYSGGGSSSAGLLCGMQCDNHLRKHYDTLVLKSRTSALFSTMLQGTCFRRETASSPTAGSKSLPSAKGPLVHQSRSVGLSLVKKAFRPTER